MNTKRSPIKFCLTCVVLLLPAVVKSQLTFTTNNNTISITGYSGSGGTIVIPSTINGYPVASIGGMAFANNANIQSVTIPEGVTTIGVDAFGLCLLTNIVIPSTVTNIGGIAFRGCGNLSDVLLPNNVLSIGAQAFEDCENLNSVNIPNSVTDLGSGAFGYCYNLASVTIGTNVTTLDGTFRYCGQLTSVIVPNSVTSITDGAFFACRRLGSVILGNGVTTIGDNNNGGVFEWCTSLTQIRIPTSVVNIGSDAFKTCALTNVTIPNNVTNIGGGAFYGCLLSSVTIGFGVTSIGGGAFFDDNLPSVLFLGNAPTAGGIIFGCDYCEPAVAAPPVYCFQGTTGWGSNFGGAPVILIGPPNTPPSITLQPENALVNAYAPVFFNVIVTGSWPLTYSWNFNGSNIANTTLNVSSNSYSIAAVRPTDLGSYSVVVSNYYGSVTSSVANLLMYPYLQNAFNGVVTYWGQTNLLSVGAWGSNLAYQWLFNGSVLPGATNATLNLNGVQFSNAGMYSVVVSSPYGSVTNAPYAVVVNPAYVALGLFPGVVITGTVGYTYMIQGSTDLSNTNGWQTLTNITLSQPVEIWNDNATDTTKPNNPSKFYRVLPGQ